MLEDNLAIYLRLQYSHKELTILSKVEESTCEKTRYVPSDNTQQVAS